MIILFGNCKLKILIFLRKWTTNHAQKYKFQTKLQKYN